MSSYVRKGADPQDWDKIRFQLRQARMDRNLTQEKVARQLGLWTGAQTISEWENGRRIPNIRDWMRWAQLVGATVTITFGEEDERTEPGS